MFSSNILDISKLIAPVRKNSPTGFDLRKEDPNFLYRKIKDARNAARNIERQLSQGIENSAKPDWRLVMELGCEILASQTKDLEICAWLIESLTRQHEFEGLSEGFHLAHELLKLYGDTLYPQPDEDGVTTQIAPFTGLNGEDSEGTLIIPISMLPLTQGNNVGPFSLWQYHQALETLKISDPQKRTQRINQGALTIEMIATAISETSPGFLQKRLYDLKNCIREFQKLNDLFHQRYGVHAPPYTRILNRLESCIEFLTMLAKQKMGEPFFEKEISAISDNQTSIMENELKIPYLDKTVNYSNLIALENKSSMIQQRDNILQSIIDAADFFRHTEPHSPIPYLLEKSVRWGKMAFPDLLQEIIQDEKTRGMIFNLTGIGK
jgi:type VI secretion system protein ImpA